MCLSLALIITMEVGDKYKLGKAHVVLQISPLVPTAASLKVCNALLSVVLLFQMPK